MTDKSLWLFGLSLLGLTAACATPIPITATPANADDMRPVLVAAALSDNSGPRYNAEGVLAPDAAPTVNVDESAMSEVPTD